MQATPHSNINNPISPTIKHTSTRPLKFGPCPPNNVNKRWPATMLAASRTAKVPGRIIVLTLSISTITGINAPGVPTGTKCAMFELNCTEILYRTDPSQSGSDKLNVKLKCLDLVKT